MSTAVGGPHAVAESIASAEAAFAAGDVTGARVLLSACAEHPAAAAPQRVLALNDLAVIAVADQRLADAEQFLLRALALDADYVPALENLGAWCLTGEDLVQATHWFRRCTEAAPEHAEGWHQLAAVLERRHRRDEAVHTLIEAASAGHEVQGRLDRMPSATPSSSGGAAISPERLVARVLIVADRFFPSVGGTERLAEDVAGALMAEGMTVDVVTRPDPRRVVSEHRGITIHEIGADVVADLHALAVGGGYDTILAFSNATVWPVIACLQLPHPRPRVVVVPCVNAADFAQLHDDPALRGAYAALVAGADAVGYSSRTAYDIRICEELGVDGVYVPNAVRRVAAPAPAATVAAIPDDAPLLVMVANLWPGKNHAGLLEALAGRPGDFRVAMIGDLSPEFPDHAAHVARLASADPRFHLVGPCAPEGVAAAMDRATALLLPSLAEATPLVLLEAMSRGLPWIAAPTCGAAHDHAGGLILPVGLFGEGIDFLLADRDRATRLGAAGQAHWRSSYTWEVVGPRYGQLLRGQPLGVLDPPPGALRISELIRAEFYDGRPAAGARPGP